MAQPGSGLGKKQFIADMANELSTFSTALVSIFPSTGEQFLLQSE